MPWKPGDEAAGEARRRRRRRARGRRRSRAGRSPAARRSRARSGGSRASAARGSPNATTAVIRPAVNGGTPNRRLSAIAAPTNSARSVAMAMISACTHRPQVTGRGSAARHSSGRLRPGGDADLGRQVLHEHRHQVRGDDHPDEQEAVLRAAGDVRGEVARVDVGDCGDEGGAEHGEAAAERPAGADRAQRADLRRGPAAARARAPGAPRRCRRRRGHRSTSTRMASASWPPSTWMASPKDANSGPPNGCFSTTSNGSPGAIPRSAR